jgi:competence ComEA-like helix-hairpin-helix protein
MSSYPLQEYFYYTRLERNAALTLMMLCLAFFMAPAAYPLFLPPKPSVDFSEIKALAASLEAKQMAVQDERTAYPSYEKRVESGPAVSIELFPFDPNEIEKEDWVRLGVSPRTAQTILNYRTKGGKFFKKEDLRRVYGLREEDYLRLAPYIRISASPEKPAWASRENDFYNKSTRPENNEQPEHERGSYVSKKEAVPVVVDVNKATPEEWQQLRGIGPAFSKRIVNFREKLGGFATLEQVGEVYGLPDTTFQKILPYLALSPIYRKINLNAATLDELKSHPCINFLQATILFNYRQQHGAFKSLEAVKKAAVGMKENEWKKLEPYLSLD